MNFVIARKSSAFRFPSHPTLSRYGRTYSDDSVDYVPPKPHQGSQKPQISAEDMERLKKFEGRSSCYSDLLPLFLCLMCLFAFKVISILVIRFECACREPPLTPREDAGAVAWRDCGRRRHGDPIHRQRLRLYGWRQRVSFYCYFVQLLF
jgi:hypothetical protein